MEGQYIIIIQFSELLFQTSLVAQMVKSLPAMWETQVRSLDWENPLKKGMQPTSVFLTWKSHE